MATKKSVDNMSADELFALASKRREQEQEQEQAREAVRAEIEALRAQRKALVAEQRKALAAIDAKIRKLGGATRTRAARGGIGDKVLAVIKAAGRITTKELRAELESQGVTTSNLSQTLAYLKRQDLVKSPARSVYSV
ncbi:MAG: hypothetical protein AB2813_02770 [Candidatus Sedimenticola endophacoides]